MGDRRRLLGAPLGVFAAIAATLMAVQHLSSAMLRPGYRWRWQGLPYYLGGWRQFDGNDYTFIAQHGYSYTPGSRSRIVWFPLYPLAMRMADAVLGNLLLAGVAVSLLAGAVAFVVFWRWLGDRGVDGSQRSLAFALFALYPYGWYLYGTVYADGLFLALALGAFLLVERRRYLTAGLVGALATATRPTGMTLVVPLVVLALERAGVLSVPIGATGWTRRLAMPRAIDPGRLRGRLLTPALSAVGLGTYMAYQWIRWGSPIIFITNERYYRPGKWPLVKYALGSALVHVRDDPRYALTTAAQTAIVVVVAATVPATCRRFGFGYGLYVALLVLMPTVSTGDYMGCGRYMTAAFPAFAVLAGWFGRHPRLQAPWLVSSALALGCLAFWFSRSAYLS